MMAWLGGLILASWLLAYGAEHLSTRFGAKFVGRTLLSVATTLPEIAIVMYAASAGLYEVAIGAGLGSNILMMTLGLALMLLIATTRLSKAPLKRIDVSTFKIDKLFLLVSALISAMLLLDGYNYMDGIIFVGMFVAYILLAFIEMKREQNINKPAVVKTLEGKSVSTPVHVLTNKNDMTKSILVFVAGTIGILVAAGPFVDSLQTFSEDIGVSTIVLAVIISPIAGEMPEKISMMILARKGAAGAAIAIANVLGSKILNNSLLLGVAIIAAMYHGGFFTTIPNSEMLWFQMMLATSITVVALIPLFKRYIGVRTGILLLGLYIFSIAVQFFAPGEIKSH
jgi:cation:H+ antiporter